MSGILHNPTPSQCVTWFWFHSWTLMRLTSVSMSLVKVGSILMWNSMNIQPTTLRRREGKIKRKLHFKSYHPHVKILTALCMKLGPRKSRWSRKIRLIFFWHLTVLIRIHNSNLSYQQEASLDTLMCTLFNTSVFLMIVLQLFAKFN